MERKAQNSEQQGSVRGEQQMRRLLKENKQQTIAQTGAEQNNTMMRAAQRTYVDDGRWSVGGRGLEKAGGLQQRRQRHKSTGG